MRQRLPSLLPFQQINNIPPSLLNVSGRQRETAKEKGGGRVRELSPLPSPFSFVAARKGRLTIFDYHLTKRCQYRVRRGRGREKETVERRVKAKASRKTGEDTLPVYTRQYTKGAPQNDTPRGKVG